MGDLAGIAERLRVVKLARRRFLRLWNIERAFIDPLVERVAADLNSPDGDHKRSPARLPQSARPSPVVRRWTAGDRWTMKGEGVVVSRSGSPCHGVTAIP